MNLKKCQRTGAWGTIISALCCFGIVGGLLAVFGATAAIAYVNKFGDFVFLPAFGVFGTMLVYSMLKIQRNWLTYSVTIAVVGTAVYFSLSLLGAVLILAGIITGVLVIKLLR